MRKIIGAAGVLWAFFGVMLSCNVDRQELRPAKKVGTVGTTGSQPCMHETESLPASGEGMWPWDQLANFDEAPLKARGLNIPLAELWTEGKGGLARAVAGLSGCTASFVSSDGLMLTNHHCVFRAIQRNSTPEVNLVEKGFLASSLQQELDGQGLEALVFIGHRDVTDLVLPPPDLGSADGDDLDLKRIRYVEDREKEIVKDCEKAPNTRCRVSRNNDGLSFVLLSYLKLRDVRLVAAPPQSLGEFGGEVDNWMWPRHTMDFAMIRAYVDPDGNPADYHQDNIPFKPERHIQIAPEGISPGDLVMVLGTPYSTSRYRTAFAVRQALEWYYPSRVSLFGEWIDTLEKLCRAIPQTCLRTSGTVKTINNGLTNARGMVTGLNRVGIVERKTAEERKWRNWVAEDSGRNALYGKVLDDLVGYLKQDLVGRDRDFLIHYMLFTRTSHLLGFARVITKWVKEKGKPDNEREPGFQQRDRDALLSHLRHAERSLHIEADRHILGMFLRRMGRLPREQRLQALDEMLGGDWSKQSIEQFLVSLYGKTALDETEVRTALFDAELSTLRSSRDSFIKLALALGPELDDWDERKKRREGALLKLRPPYIKSLVEMKGKQFYPDANASPRISFATVAGYQPRDGVWHTPQTTLDGLAQKNTGEKPFNAPEKVINAIRTGNFGSFANPVRRQVPSCFLSNADTTGGNSGSPVLNGEGRLVGLNFDRVYENISGDFGYNPLLSRNISLDVRAVLWYLDRILGAGRILGELGVVTE